MKYVSIVYKASYGDNTNLMKINTFLILYESSKIAMFWYVVEFDNMDVCLAHIKSTQNMAVCLSSHVRY